MSKAVFLNFPTHGCLNPLLATATELVSRGENVIYYCTEEFREKIDQTGAEFRPYKGLINDFKIENDDLYKAAKLSVEMTLDKLEYNLDDIRKDNPDYIIHDSLCTWGKYTASILSIPAVNLMHSFPITKSSVSATYKMLPFLFKIGIYKLMNKLLRNSSKKRLKKRYNIELSLGDILINKEDMNIIYTSKQMEMNLYNSEKSYYFVGPSLFFKNDETKFPFERLKDKKVIYISLGTLHNNNLPFYKICLEAFGNRAYFVVLSVGKNTKIEQLGNVPGNFLIRESAPQQILLDYVDLFITHAGMNSVNEAICKGVPMLLLPHQFEQEMIAKKVFELGMGEVLSIKTITSKKIFKKAHEIISRPNYKMKAQLYQSIFKKDEEESHLKAVDQILEYVRICKNSRQVNNSHRF
ncbi:MAG: hypothetical protein C0597_03160 [Marinilabiliales bacterium]|nr:MAG: hypothetical protein C0597_03160 [Marinilabiliales bacterium]